VKSKMSARFRIIALSALSLLVTIPLWMLLINSFKTPGEASRVNLGLPTKWLFTNYSDVFVEGRLLLGFLNSCLITLCSVLITLLIGSLAAYIIARRNSRLTIVIFMIFLAGMFAPPSMIPTIRVMQFLHIHGSYEGTILFYTAIFLPLSILLLTGFISNVPRSLDESAMIDGCKPFRLFWDIILPLIRPVLATGFILVFMFVWNDFNYPLYLLRDSRMWTIPMSVFNFTSAYGNQWNLVFADLIIASLPVILVYFLAQNYIIEGMTSGSIKA